ncbi:MAG: DUF1385 domain-containing protein [Candidatus Promineofilum sp.]|nr:DUF1385 domain-containing protein [Promineifilum sp.]
MDAGRLFAQPVGVAVLRPADVSGPLDRARSGPGRAAGGHQLHRGHDAAGAADRLHLGHRPHGDVKRLFGYHGAEHKTINAYEAGAELTPASVARFPLEHPRCGTAFLLTVVVISILIYSLLPPLDLLPRLLSRLVLLPVIAGIAYEFLKFTASRQGNPLVRLLTKPNLAMQRLTTREPDMDMLAVAIAAFENVLAYERSQTVVATGDTIIARPRGEPSVPILTDAHVRPSKRRLKDETGSGFT